MAPKSARQKQWEDEVNQKTTGRKVVVIDWPIDNQNFAEAQRRLKKVKVPAIRPDEKRSDDEVIITCKSLAALGGIYTMYRI